VGGLVIGTHWIPMTGTGVERRAILPTFRILLVRALCWILGLR
jgi:hypothetical protein